MEVSFLAEQSHSCQSIAQWYYDEWAKNSNVPLNAILEDVKSKSKSKNDVPLCFVATEDNEAIGAVELKLYENKQYDYKYWLGGLFVVAHI